MWFKRRQTKLDQLKAAHQPTNIALRLNQKTDHHYLGDAVLGGIDGCVTTFAIVAGTMGGGFDPLVALALGLSNLVADGFSMAVSNYQATSSLHTKVLQTRKEEAYHIEIVPEGEKEEIRQLFSQKGFSGQILEDIVKIITSDKKLWIDTMLQEGHGLPLEARSPMRSACITFISFFIVGLMPLLPFFWLLQESILSFQLSCFATGLSFFAIGLAKGWVLKTSMLKEGLEVFLFGGIAAAMSFLISYWVAA